MNNNNSLVWKTTPLEASCDLCKNKATVLLKATGFVKMSQRYLCKDHVLLWYRGELNV